MAKIKILTSFWVTGVNAQVGIVVTENEAGQRTIRAGSISALSVATEEMDAVKVAEYGGRIPSAELTKIVQLCTEGGKEKK